jgi:carboxylesterase
MSMTEKVQAGREGWHSDGTGDRASTTVVLMHGYTANPTGVNPIAHPLNDAGYGVSVVRFPGHGSTVNDFRKTRYDDWKGAGAAAIDAAAATSDKVVVVGHSMGGTIGLDITSSRSDVAGLAVINPLIEQRPDPLAKAAPVLQWIIPMVPRDLAGLPTSDIAKPDVEEDAYGVVPSKSSTSLLKQLPRIQSQLVDITIPLLVITSPQDHSVHPHNSDTVVELVGSDDVTRVTCERSYHVPQIDWDAQLVIDSILGFVEKIHAA